MDLWIRSQDKEKLLKCNDISMPNNMIYEVGTIKFKGYKIVGYFDKNTEYENLGTYKTKERALEVLKNKLYQLELENKNKELQGIKGEVMDVNFGSQIRTYVMHPYFMVKDHRTNTETSNVDKVLDGDIDLFITSYLKRGLK